MGHMPAIEQISLTKGMVVLLIVLSVESNASPLAVASWPKTIVISLRQLCLVDYMLS